MRKYVALAGVIAFFSFQIWLVLWKPFGVFSLSVAFIAPLIFSVVNGFRSCRDSNAQILSLLVTLSMFLGLFGEIDRTFQFGLSNFVMIAYIVLGIIYIWYFFTHKRLFGQAPAHSAAVLLDEAH